MDYCDTKDLKSATERMSFLGPRMLLKTAPQAVFAFGDLEHKEKSPLLLSMQQAIALFGVHFENKSEGVVDLPSFQALSEDATSLFEDIHGKQILPAIRVGENILKLVMKLPESFAEEEPDIHEVRDTMSNYKDIVESDKELTPNREKLIKAVNARLIRWIDYEKKSTCNCGLKPAIFQGCGNKLFYGCPQFVNKSDKENRCKYGKNLWMSDYKLESRS